MTGIASAYAVRAAPRRAGEPRSVERGTTLGEVLVDEPLGLADDLAPGGGVVAGDAGAGVVRHPHRDLEERRRVIDARLDNVELHEARVHQECLLRRLRDGGRSVPSPEEPAESRPAERRPIYNGF